MLQNNRFSGPLPDLSSYRQLHILRLGNNSFLGPLPPSLPESVRLVSVLDVSDNP